MAKPYLRYQNRIPGMIALVLLAGIIALAAGSPTLAADPPAPADGGAAAAAGTAALKEEEGAPDTEAEEEQPPYIYQARGLRDPFSLPPQVNKAPGGGKGAPELQQHATTDFKVVGIVWGENGWFAMVSTQDGKGYSVRQGTRIGLNGGRVRRITKDAVIVEEYYTDVFGERKRSETVLALRPEEVLQ